MHQGDEPHSPETLARGPQDVTVSDFEEASLDLSVVIVSAVILGHALLRGGFPSARAIAHRLTALAADAGHADVATAALRVAEVLGPPGAPPKEGCGQAVEALSLAIDQAQNALESGGGRPRIH